MKCPNCGFETDSDICNMCGTEILKNTTPLNYDSSADLSETVPASPVISQYFSENDDKQTELSDVESGIPIMEEILSAPQHTDKNSNKKFKNRLKIVIASVVAAIITAGIAICVVSAVSGTQSISDKLVSSFTEKNY